MRDAFASGWAADEGGPTQHPYAHAMTSSSIIVGRSFTPLSKWTSVATRTVRAAGDGSLQDYHSLAQADYVNVLAVTLSGQVPLVRQFRPAVESYTLELPGGLREDGEDPGQSVLRELREETGYLPVEPVRGLGALQPDPGRLDNRLWCYFVRVDDARDPEWVAEPGVEVVVQPLAALRDLLLSGEFNHAPHIALLGLAALHRCIEWP